MLSLDQSTQLCRLLADASRQRILLLLEVEALSVAELTNITQLSQGRISTHLSKLRAVGLISDQRIGNVRFFRADGDSDHNPALALWQALRSRIDEQQIARDQELAREAVRARHAGTSWAETVAGRMESHYSPGRTWEANARALLSLVPLGDVLDIGSGDGVLAELLLPRARSVTCVDISPTLLRAARQRLHADPRTAFVQCDMHRLPLAAGRFDQVLLMHTLTYTRTPDQVIAQAARVLRPGGTLLVATLDEHDHAIAEEVYDHVNRGIRAEALHAMMTAAGLKVDQCGVACQEGRAPYFKVVVARGRHP